MKKQIVGLVLACLMLATSFARADDEAMAKATAGVTDFTGLWWVPSENGWGMNVIQQGRTMFVTLFVYGPDSRPLWMVGSAITYQGIEGTGTQIFYGPLYQTSGPVFNAATFNPAGVGVTLVGELTFRGFSPISARINYFVNNPPTVIKEVVPQTFAPNDMSGTYIGAMSSANTACNLPPAQTAGALLTFTIRQTGTAFSMDVVASASNRCTLTGTTTQYGKQGQVSGSYSCSNNASGPFAIGQLEAGFWGITGSFVNTAVAQCASTAAAIGAARVN